MPWKQPGKGDRDPWNSGGQPPDLDEVFRSLRARLGALFGGGSGRSGSDNGSGGGILTIIVLLLLFWIAWDAVHIIDAAERGVVLRFGKVSRELQPGLNLTLPRPVEAVFKVNVSDVRSVTDRGHMLTEDENLIEFNYEVQYRVANAQDFLFRVRSPEITLQHASESALRESVGTNSLDEILEGSTRQLVRTETQRVLQETLDRYQAGMLITQFNLVDVNVPAQVREAYSDVIRAREDRERFIEEARVHANSVIPEARGAAARILQEAQGYRDSTIALAEGEAARFSLLLSEYQRAPEVTRKRMYLQTMEGVLARSNKVLLDVDASGNILYLPLDALGAGGTSAKSGGRVAPPPIGVDSGAAAESEESRNASRNPDREPRP